MSDVKTCRGDVDTKRKRNASRGTVKAYSPLKAKARNQRKDGREEERAHITEFGREGKGRRTRRGGGYVPAKKS